jgi:hypothetical protein
MGPSMRIGAWVISSCGLSYRASCLPHGSSRGWPVCCNEFSSGHWPALGGGGHNCGCHVGGPLNLSCDQLWVIPLLTLVVKSYLWVHVVITTGDDKGIRTFILAD